SSYTFILGTGGRVAGFGPAAALPGQTQPRRRVASTARSSQRSGHEVVSRRSGTLSDPFPGLSSIGEARYWGRAPLSPAACQSSGGTSAGPATGAQGSPSSSQPNPWWVGTVRAIAAAISFDEVQGLGV